MSDDPSDSHFRYVLSTLPKVLQTGVFHNPKGTVWPVRKLPVLSLNYVACGSARCKLGGQPFPFRAGHVYLWRPGDEFGGEVDEYLMSLYVRFTWPEAAGGSEVLLLPRRNALSPSTQNDFKETLDLLIESSMARRPGWELATGGYLQVLLGLLQRETQRPSTPEGKSPNPALDRRLGLALAYMESHYDERLRIGQIAREARLSEDYFRRLFAQRIGLSPVQYLNRLRVRVGRRLLAQDPTLSVREACRQAGFGDARHFARIFRKHYHLTPDQYRRSLGPQL